MEQGGGPIPVLKVRCGSNALTGRSLYICWPSQSRLADCLRSCRAP